MNNKHIKALVLTVAVILTLSVIVAAVYTYFNSDSKVIDDTTGSDSEIIDDKTVIDYKYSIYCPKIGKADAFLIYNDTMAVLIDTGDKDSSDELLDFISEKDIRTINALILTHFDKDHIGSAADVLRNTHVEHLYRTDFTEDSEEYSELQKAVADEKTDVINVEYTITQMFGDLKVVIYPPLKTEYVDGNDNNRSIITSVECGNSNLLFMGDALEERVNEFFKFQYENIDYEFLKVPHHGQDKDSVKTILKHISPKYALISSSKKEKEKNSVTKLLKKHNTKVYLTRKAGYGIYVSFDKEHMTVIKDD